MFLTVRYVQFFHYITILIIDPYWDWNYPVFVQTIISFIRKGVFIEIGQVVLEKKISKVVTV